VWSSCWMSGILASGSRARRRPIARVGEKVAWSMAEGHGMDGQAAEALAFRAWAISKTPDLQEAATSADASWYWSTARRNCLSASSTCSSFDILDNRSFLCPHSHPFLGSCPAPPPRAPPSLGGGWGLITSETITATAVYAGTCPFEEDPPSRLGEMEERRLLPGGGETNCVQRSQGVMRLRNAVLGLVGIALLGLGISPQQLGGGDGQGSEAVFGAAELIQESGPRGYDVRWAREEQLAGKRGFTWKPLTLDEAKYTRLQGSIAAPRKQTYKRFFGLGHFPGGALSARKGARTEALYRLPSGGARLGLARESDVAGVQGAHSDAARSRGRAMAAAKAAATRQSQLFELEDNGKVYKMPWWCVMVHNEADGSGKGWDGGKSPQGASGPRGIDCRPPKVVNGTAFPEAEEAAEEQAAQEETAEEAPTQ
jgi:hypothetical protein